MIRLFFVFLISLVVTLFALSKAEPNPMVPGVEQSMRPPYIIKYLNEDHAVFNYGGLQFLFFVTKMPTTFPQCDAIQKL